MSIEALQAVMTPPESPIESIGDWDEVEQRLGRSLPADYRDFISVYGTGYIDKFLSVLNPFSAIPSYNLISAGRDHLDGLRQLRETRGEFLPYALFPEKSGLLPIAMTDNGDTLHWLTEGRADHWRIVVEDVRAPETEIYEMTFTQFLTALIQGQIFSNILVPLGQGGRADFEVVDKNRLSASS